MNRVLLTGRLTRDPELRTTASGKAVTQFGIATHEFVSGAKEKSEYHNIVTWDRLAEICGRYLSKGQQVAIEGRLQTRTWDDEAGKRHWKTEVVAGSVEMLAGRRRKDYAAETSASALEQQGIAAGINRTDASEPIPDDAAFLLAGADPEGDEEDEADEDLEEAVAA